MRHRELSGPARDRVIVTLLTHIVLEKQKGCV